MSDLDNVWKYLSKDSHEYLEQFLKNAPRWLLEEFREVLYKKVRELHVQKYPYNDFLYNIEEQETID